MAGKQLPQVNVKLDQQVTVNVFGLGSISIELLPDGKCFITGPLLTAGRRVFQFAKPPYGIFESSSRDRYQASEPIKHSD